MLVFESDGDVVRLTLVQITPTPQLLFQDPGGKNKYVLNSVPPIRGTKHRYQLEAQGD